MLQSNKLLKGFWTILTKLNCLIRVVSHVIIFVPSIASNAANRIFALASDKTSTMLLFLISMSQFDLQLKCDTLPVLILITETILFLSSWWFDLVWLRVGKIWPFMGNIYSFIHHSIPLFIHLFIRSIHLSTFQSIYLSTCHISISRTFHLPD